MAWQEGMRFLAVDVLRQHYADVKPELHFENPFQLLVAVVLSAQSTDKQVNRTTQTLFQQIRTPGDLAVCELTKLEEMIKGVGLFRSKARNLVQLGKILTERFDGEVPQSVAELETLPGVGRKTANVVVSIAFGIPAMAVDTHVFRVSNRIGLAEAKNVTQTEKQLTALISQDEWSIAHHWLIHHGRYRCKAQKPQCEDCPLQLCCRYFLNELTERNR